jgi:hypothetical protein
LAKLSDEEIKEVIRQLVIKGVEGMAFSDEEIKEVIRQLVNDDDEFMEYYEPDEWDRAISDASYQRGREDREKEIVDKWHEIFYNNLVAIYQEGIIEKKEKNDRHHDFSSKLSLDSLYEYLDDSVFDYLEKKIEDNAQGGGELRQGGAQKGD